MLSSGSYSTLLNRGLRVMAQCAGGCEQLLLKCAFLKEFRELFDSVPERDRLNRRSYCYDLPRICPVPPPSLSIPSFVHCANTVKLGSMRESREP